MSDSQKESVDSRQWFLRTGGESIFGPVSTQGLIVWAEQGRILPGHEVSNDRKKWVQAISVGLLDMRWFVDDGEGELRGPLNRLAAEALLKSGKVPEGAQIVSADDVETAAEPGKEPAAASERVARDQIPEGALLARVRELESLVTAQRERLSKLANVDAIETAQQERDALATLMKELESQRDTILKNAEKDARASERKQEQLRQQIRKLEQQIEESGSRQLLKDQTVAAAEASQTADDARAQVAEQALREAAALIAQVTREAEQTRESLAVAVRQLAESHAAAEATQAAFEQERAERQARLAALEQAVQFHEKRNAETQQSLDAKESELVVQVSREAELSRESLTIAERQLAESHAATEAAQAAFEQERAERQARLAALEQAVQFLEKRCAETQQILDAREAELAAQRLRVTESERRLAAAESRASSAERKAAENEAAFAELLSDANARDNANADKIAALEKLCVQPPGETDRFFSDRAAVFELVNTEIGELAKTMELERVHVEQLKEWSVQRQQSLMERKQTLLMQLGGSPADMTRRAAREQSSDPNAARLRAELDELRAVHQRQGRLAEERERDLQRKLRVFEAEAGKLQVQAIAGEKVGRRLQELSEQLSKRDQELTDERKNREAEREQFLGNQQALLMRIDLLEKASRSGTPDEIRSAEAKNVKIATWMRLKK